MEPKPNGLCPRLHCSDAEPTRESPVSLALATNGGSQSLQNLNTVMLIHCLILWGVIRVNNSFQVKNNQHDFHFGTHLKHSPPPGLETRTTIPTRLIFLFRIISVNPCLVTCDDVFHEIPIRFCLMKKISGDRRAAFLLL
jgi:hypothetical protein